MIAQVGDRIILAGAHVGDGRRTGVISGLTHADGSPPYLVRWLASGHCTLIFPGPDARLEHGDSPTVGP